jgi:hypothetical protein
VLAGAASPIGEVHRIREHHDEENR